MAATRGAPTAGDTQSQGKLYAQLLGVAVLVVVLDQATKQVALSALSDGPIHLISGAVSLRLAYNSGGAFGLLQGMPELFLVATLAITVGILVWVRSLEDRRWIVPLGMILGGGLGNIFDRLFRGFDGRVVDFIDFHVWPVFNLADSSITIGVLLILLLGSRPPKAA